MHDEHEHHPGHHVHHQPLERAHIHHATLQPELMARTVQWRDRRAHV